MRLSNTKWVKSIKMKCKQPKFKSKIIFFFSLLFLVIIISNLLTIHILSKPTHVTVIILVLGLLVCFLFLVIVSKSIYHPSKLFVAQLSKFLTTGFNAHDKKSNFQQVQLEKLPLMLSEVSNVLFNEIDKRKQAEVDLQESELKYRNLFEISQHLIWQCDVNGCYTFLNSAWESIMEYKIEEMLGRPMGDFVNEKQAKIDIETYNKVIQGINISGYETVFISKSGKNIYLEINARLQKNTKGVTIGAHGTAYDITSRRNAEIELKRSEERLNRVASAYNDGIAYSYKSIIKQTNYQFAKIFGYTPDELVNKDWKELSVADDHELIIQHSVNAFDKLYEFRGVKKDGTIIYIEVKGITIPFENNNYRLSIVRHISERKNTEILVRKLNAAIAQSANCIIITDPDGNIEYVNKKFTELTGYLAHEAIGKNPKMLQSGKHSRKFYSEIWTVLLNKKEWKGEFYNKKKSGELYWESTTITPVLGANNELLNYIAVKEDITFQKQAKQKILNATIEAEEKERKRFAEDLHDELGPYLSGIKLYTSQFTQKELSLASRLELTKNLEEMIDESIAKTKLISNSLMPNILMDFGYIKALESFIKKGKITQNIQFEFIKPTTLLPLSSTIEVVLYRVLIELINNTLKHAMAKKIKIIITYNKSVKIEYFDDGIGFDFDRILAEQKGNGLINITNRLKSINADYNFNNHQKNGIYFKIKINN